MGLRTTKQGFKSSNSDKELRELVHKLDLIESQQKDYAKIIEKIVGFKIRNYNTYQPRIVIKEGLPDPNEGIEGIFSLRKLQRGIFLFIYYRNKWWKVTQLTDFTHQGNTNTQNNPTMAASMADEAFSNLAVNGKLNIKPVAASTDTDKFLVSDNGEIKFRTGAQVSSDTSTAASTSASGIVELATTAETTTGTDTARAVTPDGLKDGYEGSSNIETVGDLDAGAITSGFGNINNGSSTITTTGAISGGSFNHFMDVKIHQFYSGVTTDVYMPFGGSQVEAAFTSDSLNDDTLFIAPYNGYLEKVVFQNANTAGDMGTDVRMYLRVAGSLGTVKVADVTNETTATWTFGSDESFTAGQRLRIYIRPNSVAPKYVTATSVWRYTI
jgi:hypothetical protein